LRLCEPCRRSPAGPVPLVWAGRSPAHGAIALLGNAVSGRCRLARHEKRRPPIRRPKATGGRQSRSLRRVDWRATRTGEGLIGERAIKEAGSDRALSISDACCNRATTKMLSRHCGAAHDSPDYQAALAVLGNAAERVTSGSWKALTVESARPIRQPTAAATEALPKAEVVIPRKLTLSLGLAHDGGLRPGARRQRDSLGHQSHACAFCCRRN
jgi:hypothetical protein